MTKVTVLLSVLLSLLFIYNSLQAEDNVLQADFRHRPPEMIVEGKKMWGPLKDILEEAAKKIEYRIKWRIAPFARSLGDLKKGVSDILPRTVRTEEREVFVNYLGPIGYQQKDILFLVKKGKEDLINRYEDLKGLSIAVKRKTAYFKRFDKETTFNKIETKGDDIMAKMFQKGRFDTMAVLDRVSLEKAMGKYNITNYSYANYRHIQRNGNYYGMSKTSINAGIYEQLNEILMNMAKSGKVTEIYMKYELEPPLQN
jgi:polar amino acid transport system substrate-binding protein